MIISCWVFPEHTRTEDPHLVIPLSRDSTHAQIEAETVLEGSEAEIILEGSEAEIILEGSEAEIILEGFRGRWMSEVHTDDHNLEIDSQRNSAGDSLHPVSG